MNPNSVPLEYVNNLMYELEKAFWDERGKGARFRMTKVGYQYFSDKVSPLLQSTEVEDILNKVSGVLKNEGIAADVSYSREERLLKVSVKGCIHRPVEERMRAKGVEPFTCVPANLIVLAIEEKLDIPVELAEIKVEEGTCQLLLVMFEKRPVLE
ncbi:hypothetical protein ANAEL_01125 [Anaerolineales bacterium]|nr:hypothetical protein ANAEL_01125 [Anaerolineales bacterium]